MGSWGIGNKMKFPFLQHVDKSARLLLFKRRGGKSGLNTKLNANLLSLRDKPLAAGDRGYILSCPSVSIRQVSSVHPYKCALIASLGLSDPLVHEASLPGALNPSSLRRKCSPEFAFFLLDAVHCYCPFPTPTLTQFLISLFLKSISENFTQG